MINENEHEELKRRSGKLIQGTGLVLTPAELDRIEVADFGLGHPSREGAQILTLLQSERITVKLVVLITGQTLPEHWHPPVGTDPGKEETIRVLRGRLRLYVDGPDSIRPGVIPEGKESVYTCRQEHLLEPGQQHTLESDEKHWFQAGSEPVVFFSFSTVARDALDRFTDPAVKRFPPIQPD